MKLELLNTSGIYAIENIASGKRYVGSTTNLKKRHREHFWMLRNRRHWAKALQSAWNKYGEQAFRLVVIEFCDKTLLVEREQYHIDTRSEYNCRPTAHNQLGFRHSEETKAKLAATMREKIDRYRSMGIERMRDPVARNRSSETAKARLSKPGGFEASVKALSSAKSAESRAVSMGTNEYRENMRKIKMGHRHTPETIEKMKASYLRRRAQATQSAGGI